MIKAHVVHSGNRHLYEREFDEFLRRRHDFFAVKKRWVPESSDGREIDEFDTNAATYLLGVEEDGSVVTSCRLIPTSERHLVSEKFERFCELTGVPRRADWAEWTRTYVSSEASGMSRRGHLTQICCAVMEYALAQGLRAVGGIQETYFLPQHRMLNWKVRPCGLSQEVNGEHYIVAYIRVDDAALASARRVLGIDHSLIVEHGESRAFVPYALGQGVDP